MFKQLNLEKPTKWFLNLASDKLSTDSPANKLRIYCDKYKNTADWGKKYEKKEEMQTDLHDHLEDHKIKTSPEKLGKKLTKAEREATEDKNQVR